MTSLLFVTRYYCLIDMLCCVLINTDSDQTHLIHPD